MRMIRVLFTAAFFLTGAVAPSATKAELVWDGFGGEVGGEIAEASAVFLEGTERFFAALTAWERDQPAESVEEFQVFLGGLRESLAEFERIREGFNLEDTPVDASIVSEEHQFASDVLLRLGVAVPETLDDLVSLAISEIERVLRIADEVEFDTDIVGNRVAAIRVANAVNRALVIGIAASTFVSASR